jgi:hypothetical protein
MILSCILLTVHEHLPVLDYFCNFLECMSRLYRKLWTIFWRFHGTCIVRTPWRGSCRLPITQVSRRVVYRRGMNWNFITKYSTRQNADSSTVARFANVTHSLIIQNNLVISAVSIVIRLDNRGSIPGMSRYLSLLLRLCWLCVTSIFSRK